MRRFILLFIIIFQIFLFSGVYSVLSENTPFGIVAIWPGWSNSPSYWRNYYFPEIETSLKADFFWNRPNCLISSWNLISCDIPSGIYFYHIKTGIEKKGKIIIIGG